MFLTDTYEDEFQNFNIDSINIIESKLMYSKPPYYTYRVIWDYSSKIEQKNVTYLTIENKDNHFKLVGMSTKDAYPPQN